MDSCLLPLFFTSRVIKSHSKCSLKNGGRQRQAERPSRLGSGRYSTAKMAVSLGNGDAFD